jgi:SAM-dependent methyltransferase
MYGKLENEWYGHSDFWNFGYWTESTHDQKQACEQLMDKLLTRLQPTGNILDVACGKGATTRYLLKRFQPMELTGVDFSDLNVETACANVPGVRFLRMDATQLDFHADSFDAIICVEAAFLFQTRQAFLREAHRVLKPGGVLVMSDILCEVKAGPLKVNNVGTLQEYRSRLSSAGFNDVEIEDATYNSWVAFVRERNAYVQKLAATGRMTYRAARRLRLRAFLANVFLRYYVLVAAHKDIRHE